MARTEITAIDLPGALDYDGTALTWTAADSTNKNFVDLTGREIVLIRNDNVGVQTVTIQSKADAYGRERDCDIAAIPASAFRVAGPFPKDGWDNGGQLHLDAAAADVFFCVLRLPSSWAGR